ncbi:replication initiation protein RepC [Salipiger aestuarii]|uniref:replication initiation protein RepC n=1 Tax=Salipiger aestuarii TaxID=568098 RepID=UPI001CC315EF|nr:replication initiation protein RepC [Salipiger aestuarii]KAA8610518.1 hypothetical protein AL037_13520 [Salipiger aestuarii]
MAPHQITAPNGQRPGGALSADNAPERHVVMAMLRRAAPLLGLRAPVLATLNAMLSCLPPRRSHHTVFASNETLVFRRDGISERTIRRHVVQLIEAGLLLRHDSANRKRFMRRSRADGTCLRFGFDLSPLFAQIERIARIAAQADDMRDRLALLRTQIRAAANQRLRHDDQDPAALHALKALRRKLDADDCAALLADLPDVRMQPLDTDPCEPDKMTGRHGQNVRHHQNSIKDINDKKERLTMHDLSAACPEALAFASHPLGNERDVISHGRTLAPMIGIDPKIYSRAEDRVGATGAAVAVMAVIQMQDRVRALGAYFHALVLGPKSAEFDALRLIRFLQRFDHCPRTTRPLTAAIAR